MSRGRHVDRERRRAGLLAAAKATFAGRGYHDTTIADVARAAGAAYGSVYWYFESKDALFEAVLDEQERALRDHIDAAMATAGADPEAAFRHAVRATFEFFEADPDVARLLFRDRRRAAGIHDGFVDDLEKHLGGFQAAGFVVDAPTRVVAFSVAALISQLALRRLVTDDGLSAGQLADITVTLLLEGLRPR